MGAEARLQDGEILLDLSAQDLPGLVQESVERLARAGKLEAAQRDAIERSLRIDGIHTPTDLGNGVGVVRLLYEGDEEGSFHCVLLRASPGIRARDHEWIHFLWLVIAPRGVATPSDEQLEPFAWMLHDDRYSASVWGADDPRQVLATYQLYLEYVQSPPSERRPSMVPTLPESEETAPRGFAAGLKSDIERRRPYYRSDFTDGLNTKSLASVLFIFFACFAPSVAFGGLLDYLTDGQIGAVETILTVAVGGAIYALFSGQPLTLLGTTGPLAIFLGLLYALCEQLGVPYLAGLFWVGIWSSAAMLFFALGNTARYIQYFTRFTDEIFGALIALIFVTAALGDIFGGVFGPEPPSNSKLLALIVALGTYLIAAQLSRMRQKSFLTQWAREFFADFGPAIAIFAMTGLAFVMRPIALPHLHVPLEFATTTGRPWLVDPFEAPVWFWFASIPIAVLSSVLLYLDQNITVRLVNSPQHRLKKGAGYSLDMLVIAVLTALCAMFGLPWIIAATVRSLNHVRSLADIRHHAHGEHIISVRENRLTGLVVAVLIGLSLLFLDLLRQIPMAVIFGLFLFMGIGSTRGNQFVDRLRLWVTDPALYPPTHYVRRVRPSVIHAFTAIQVACLALLWFIKESTIGVLFPLFIALLVPVRALLNRFFDSRDLAFLDADENPEEEMYRETD